MSALATSFGLRTPLGMTGTTRGARFLGVKRSPSCRLLTVELANACGVFRVGHASMPILGIRGLPFSLLLGRQVAPIVLGPVPSAMSCVIAFCERRIKSSPFRVRKSRYIDWLMRQQVHPDDLFATLVRGESSTSSAAVGAAQQRLEHDAAVLLAQPSSFALLRSDSARDDVVPGRQRHDDGLHVPTRADSVAVRFAKTATEVEQRDIGFTSERRDATPSCAEPTLERVPFQSVLRAGFSDTQVVNAMRSIFDCDDRHASDHRRTDVQATAPERQANAATSSLECPDAAIASDGLGWGSETRLVAFANLTRIVRVARFPRLASSLALIAHFILSTGSPASVLSQKRGVEMRLSTAVAWSLA